MQSSIYPVFVFCYPFTSQHYKQLIPVVYDKWQLARRWSLMTSLWLVPDAATGRVFCDSSLWINHHIWPRCDFDLWPLDLKMYR